MKIIRAAVVCLMLTAASLAVEPKHQETMMVTAVQSAWSANTWTTSSGVNSSCWNTKNGVSCSSSSYGGDQKAIYHFQQVVRGNDGNTYTLGRTASWAWSNTSQLEAGETFPAVIKGKNMYITGRQGGNQGRKVTLKYTILDIRPGQENGAVVTCDENGKNCSGH